jgi:cell volume regulation protein A
MANEFFFISLTIITGFAATLVFERTKISQVILLMLFGFLLGPVLGLLNVSSGSIIVSMLPFISTLALIFLLFDGGVEFDVFSVARSIPKSMLFTFLVFGLSVVLVGGFSYFVLGWPLLQGLLLGAVTGGSSSAIVIAMVEKTNTSKETKSLLTVESTMTDALCIITAIILVQLITANQAPEAGTVVGLLLSSFTTAILMGVLGAGLWMFVLGKFRIERYSYMLMLALIFALFALTESIKASGGVAVFVFGIILGNARKIGKFAKIDWENPMKSMMRQFQDEVTFFVRTFFFVYIGLLLSLDYFNTNVILITLGLIAVYALARLIISRLVLGGILPKDRNVIVSMMPRGLAAAVLATLPLTSGIDIPDFQQLVFGVLLFSNIAATLGVFLSDRP